MSLSSSSDDFIAEPTPSLRGVPNIVRVMDDLLRFDTYVTFNAAPTSRIVSGKGLLFVDLEGCHCPFFSVPRKLVT